MQRPKCILNSQSLLHDAGDRLPVQIPLSTLLDLSGRLEVDLRVLPPGSRLSAPIAHSEIDMIAYCVSGNGVVWQNGWTYPLQAGDAVSMRGGSGISHTIINDLSPSAQNLTLLVAYEGALKGEEDLVHFALGPDSTDDTPEWHDPPPQSEFGSQSALPLEVKERKIEQTRTAPRPSNIVYGPSQLAAAGGGDLFVFATPLATETGLSGRFGCNLEVQIPGTRSSNAHAHSQEDEIILILSGQGSVWINGYTFPVSTGDVIGFPSGTGIAHCLLNDSNETDQDAGEPVITLILGENRRQQGDLLYYPLNREEMSTFPRWWHDPPLFKLGPHPGRPTHPREDDEP